MDKRVETDLRRTSASAALNVALRDRAIMNQREVAQTLIMVADYYPDLIEDEIARLTNRIRMLRDYLPLPAHKDQAE